MKFRPTIGLIIQGPLLTYGQGPNNIIEGFNCLDVIAGTISAAQKHGIVHCVSTWHPQSLHENALLQQLLLTEANVLLLDPPILDPDHRQKHHYGIRAGITEIEANYIIKVRTDMVIPDAFWDWVKSNAESNTFREKLLVSELYTPFYLGDFIYATSRRNMIRFLDSVLAYGTEVLHPSVTTDIGFKYFVSITNNHLRVINILFSYFFIKKNLSINGLLLYRLI
ncbi:MAG: hypothetical protein QE283_04160 [Rhodoferax sp.]|nr:hypothetical protein [Rhodoferax sp.]